MSNLRDALLNGLKSLPGTREFHLHVLVSSPRKHGGLYPFSIPRSRSYLQDVLILLSEQSTLDSPRIFVTAIEACVYNVAATSSAILYISKVDSTGQASYPSPTATLVKSFLLYYADPATRPIDVDHLWIQLFARAQKQYVFPNSSEYEGKKWLNDTKLCSWWKQVYTDVSMELASRLPSTALVKLYYLIPGYTQLEAEHSLKIASSFASNDNQNAPMWVYGHPYSQMDIPLPCPRDASSSSSIVRNLGHYIPSFDDDPKSRFMDEIAYTTEKEGIKSPPRKRARTISSSRHADAVPASGSVAAGGDEAEKPANQDRPLGELGKVSPDEFWERMSFRQECVSGAVTGFFTMGTSFKAADSDGSRSAVSPLAPQAGQVSSNVNKRVMTSLMTGVEFSTRERAINATESIENAIKGLCEGIALVPVPATQATRPKSTSNQEDQHRQLSETEVSTTYLAPPRTPPRRNRELLPDISPNPFPEPEPTLETYNSHIYGSVRVSNPPKTRDEGVPNGEKKEATSTPQVTVLAVRKKKKRAD
ncbi:duf1714 domain-containing protein [Moniliophthora roreri MCA 2997]|uniref:histone acetyltransferase n=2 Tax=Moniliophthora roreri TaxID=221103 RepID=V2YTN4_MONRO|nr:duf1714 domain-containing protein [Moniliophthora roreri MCA 2997]KAI3608075.1 duf1714 domain-containing protein [Moniliophthora roreri]